MKAEREKAAENLALEVEAFTAGAAAEIAALIRAEQKRAMEQVLRKVGWDCDGPTWYDRDYDFSLTAEQLDALLDAP